MQDSAMNSYSLLLLSVLFVASTVSPGLSSECSPRKFDEDSFVCVCNVTYCDSFDPIETSSNIQAFVSTSSGLRFQRSEIKATKAGDDHNVKETADIVISVNSSQRYQSIIGFGAAFTDAAGISTSSLDSRLQDELIRQYWSPSGLRYNLGRVVIGGSDFSTRGYSYDDVSFDDFELKNFSLTREDFDYKIPFIKKALDMTHDEVLLYGSAWSAPSWMKTNNALNGRGFLKGDTQGPYFRVWAEYYIRFLEEYEKQGISFWGLTTGNEPINGFAPKFPFNCLAFTPATQRDFIKYHLGPVLANSSFAKTVIMTMDDGRPLVPIYPPVTLNDPAASKYISGVALHWYQDKRTPIALVDLLHHKYQNKFILNTEATHEGKPKLGNWQRAVEYLESVVNDLNHWYAGWVEWNFSLDLGGGPNWVQNWCDAPIIVNATSGEFYKQPMYYALAHVTRFVPRASRRVAHHIKDNTCELPFLSKVVTGAFITPRNETVVIISNKDSSAKSALIKELDTEVQYRITMPAKSFVTLHHN